MKHFARDFIFGGPKRLARITNWLQHPSAQFILTRGHARDVKKCIVDVNLGKYFEQITDTRGNSYNQHIHHNWLPSNIQVCDKAYYLKYFIAPYFRHVLYIDDFPEVTHLPLNVEVIQLEPEKIGGLTALENKTQANQLSDSLTRMSRQDAVVYDFDHTLSQTCFYSSIHDPNSQAANDLRLWLSK